MSSALCAPSESERQRARGERRRRVFSSVRPALVATDSSAARRLLAFFGPACFHCVPWSLRDSALIRWPGGKANSRVCHMRYLHTMIRVTDLDASLAFFIGKMGTCGDAPARRREGTLHAGVPRRVRGRGSRRAPTRRRLVELTYNWDPEVYGGGRNFGHLAYEVDDIYAYCAKLQRRRRSSSIARRATAAWRSSARPTTYQSNFCRRARRSRRAEPWASMPNTGVW